MGRGWLELGTTSSKAVVDDDLSAPVPAPVVVAPAFQSSVARTSR